ncbi:MAG: hypothetical protein ACF8LK_03000 [Phycisphaerales bacterium JB041]
MARSHICLGCGTELAHLAAPPDRHYGLPVVVCPRCTLASVRRPFGGRARWRTFLRSAATVRRLVFGACMFALLTVLGVVFCAGIAAGLSDAFYRQPIGEIIRPNEIVRARFHNWWIDEGFWIVPSWAVLWSIHGLFAGLWFPHWRVKRYLAGMAALAAASVVVPLTLAGLSRWAADGSSPFEAVPHELRNPVEAASFFVPLAAGVLLSSILLHGGLRAGRRVYRDRGLRSPKLRRARRAREREA